MPIFNPNAWVGVDAGTGLPVNNFNAQTYGGLNQFDYGQLLAQQQAQQQQNYGSENALGNSLLSTANGTAGVGSSLAQQMLQQQTQANIQSQAGADASLRGLNPAQQARLIAMGGVNAQQQAVGQATTAAMQEQWAAQQQLAALYGQQGQQNIAGFGQGQQGMQGQNALNLQNYENTQNLNQQTATQNANLKSTAQGQNLQSSAADNLLNGNGQGGGLVGNLGKALTGGSLGGGGGGAAPAGGALGDFSSVADVAALASRGGVVPRGRPNVIVSPGEGVVSPSGRESKVPGRAKVAGDSPRNDTVPKHEKPGTVIVPRTVEKDPLAKAAFLEMVSRHKKKHGKKEMLA